jgi:hypothetical protein
MKKQMNNKEYWQLRAIVKSINCKIDDLTDLMVSTTDEEEEKARRSIEARKKDIKRLKEYHKKKGTITM